MKRNWIIGFFVLILVTSCTDNGQTNEKITKSVENNKINNLSNYLGEWLYVSGDGKTLKNGSGLIISKIGADYIIGSCTSVQSPPACRVATIYINGKLNKDKYEFTYASDGFTKNGSGYGYIKLMKNYIIVKLNTKVSDDNMTGWNIGSGIFKYVRNK